MAPSFKTCAGLNFFRPYFHYCLSSDHCCEDRFHIGLASTFTSLFAVHINNFVYSQSLIRHFTGLLQTSTIISSQLACQLTSKALHRYRRGHGFKSPIGLNFFRAYFHHSLSSVDCCEDRFRFQI